MTELLGRRMRRTIVYLRASFISLSLIWLINCPEASQGQGSFTWTVTFDSNPPIARTNEVATSYYQESGMAFTPIGQGQFGRSGGGAIRSTTVRVSELLI